MALIVAFGAVRGDDGAYVLTMATAGTAGVNGRGAAGPVGVAEDLRRATP